MSGVVSVPATVADYIMYLSMATFLFIVFYVAVVAPIARRKMGGSR